MSPLLWLRHESRPDERRAPLAPEHAGELTDRGLRLVVEESPQRVFPIEAYAAAGCTVAPAGSWPDAPADTCVLGLKELPPLPYALTHRHIFFGHAYKGQPGGVELLRRFVAGGGALLDLEHLVDGGGRRVAAFGYWAGYAGAAVAALHAHGLLPLPLAPRAEPAWDAALDALRTGGRTTDAKTTALVTGAGGRCGTGARRALERAGIPSTRWGAGDTARLDRQALLSHDLLINAIGTADPLPPFLTGADLDDPLRRLRLLCDVTCDLGAPSNAVPVYDRLTSWAQPVLTVRRGERPFEVIALDNLPSLVPAEASRAFSADLSPHLLTLGDGSPVWSRGLAAFGRSLARNGLG